ncbi:polysaccharide deacetylase [Fictibacillus sp. KIGAM418]|uniref:Polysaccharide deacetylase n=1 Tax=Fictibacillus marinisediminis TaxID=2878389 RepID=A0A9X1XKM1_9BACL|nr:polysaccharide deacetylase family protein [Fictibacillus marinisediminis]MCK6259289.1 polysaccharide deacetylase [Fictibacillus marinisediminis]
MAAKTIGSLVLLYLAIMAMPMDENRAHAEQQTEHKKVYLTFDDGPSKTTGQLMKDLNDYGASATFFMLAPHMEQYPIETMRLAYSQNSVGCHGVTHDKDAFYHSESTVTGEMKTCRQTLENLTGIHSNLVRVPYGSVPYMKPEYVEALKRDGFIMWDWNVDSVDWGSKDDSWVNKTLQQVEQVEKNHHDPVILMHDKELTAKELPELLGALKKKGYEFSPISEKQEPVNFQ